MEHDFSRRRFLQYATYAGGALALTGCTTGKSGAVGSSDRLGAALPPLEGAQVVLDPAQFPKAFKESPEFAKKSAAGQLPPVAQRIGQDPLVIKPVHGVGHYGGELRRAYLDVGDNLAGSLFCAGPDSLTYVDYSNKQV